MYINSQLTLLFICVSIQNQGINYCIFVYLQNQGINSGSNEIRITIKVKDMNNEIPRFEGLDPERSTMYVGSVPENEPVGQTVITVKAVDDDADIPNNVVSIFFDFQIAFLQYTLPIPLAPPFFAPLTRKMLMIPIPLGPLIFTLSHKKVVDDNDVPKILVITQVSLIPHPLLALTFSVLPIARRLLIMLVMHSIVNVVVANPPSFWTNLPHSNVPLEGDLNLPHSLSPTKPPSLHTIFINFVFNCHN